MTIPSAAAVASSRREAFAMSIEVNDVTIVWKLTRDSSRPAHSIREGLISRGLRTNLEKSLVDKGYKGYTMQDFP